MNNGKVILTMQEKMYFNVLKAIGKLRLSEKDPEKDVKPVRLKTKIHEKSIKNV